MKLTDETILNAKPKNKEYLLNDGGGLYLRVKPNGSKLWRAEFSVPTGRIRPHIGFYPQVSLKKAREIAMVHKYQISQGIDPRTRLDGGLLRETVMDESTDKSTGVLAVVAGLIAAVRLARVESGELQIGSPDVRSAIADSITIAKMVIEASRQ